MKEMLSAGEVSLVDKAKWFLRYVLADMAKTDPLAKWLRLEDKSISSWMGISLEVAKRCLEALYEDHFLVRVGDHLYFLRDDGFSHLA